MRALAVLAVTLAPALAAGCASIASHEGQPVTIITRSSSGTAVDNATCVLENSRGRWELKTPGFVFVRRSSDDLMVKCSKEGMPDGYLKAVSRAANGMIGNVLFGGVIGAVIDHGNGTGYDYPNDLRVTMGRFLNVDPNVGTTDIGSAPEGDPTSVFR